MTFNEWWNENNYPDDCKEMCYKAFEAGCEDNFNHANREINNRDAIINFLKKELIKKSAFKNVMKRQYRELRQKYDTVKPRTEYKIDLKLHKFAWFDVTDWSEEEGEELAKKWKQIENRT